MFRRNLTGVTVDLPDTCRWCRAQTVAHTVMANTSAEDNWGACRYKLLCAGCSQFRGYVSRDLELRLDKLTKQNTPQPIWLAGRKRNDDDADGN
jgi:hypothetical protein